MLCQPQRQQSPDEDGAGVGAGEPCQLYSRSTGAWRFAQAHLCKVSATDPAVRSL